MLKIGGIYKKNSIFDSDYYILLKNEKNTLYFYCFDLYSNRNKDVQEIIKNQLMQLKQKNFIKIFKFEEEDESIFVNGYLGDLNSKSLSHLQEFLKNMNI